jgi:hypothetical protein
MPITCMEALGGLADKFLGMSEDQFAATTGHNVEESRRLRVTSLAAVLCLLSACFEKMPLHLRESVKEAFSSLLDSHVVTDNENAPPNSTHIGEGEQTRKRDFSIQTCTREARKLSEHFRLALESV